MDSAQIVPALQRVFNSLLERQEDTAIKFVRAHRALRARGPDMAPPRDIICCLQSFHLKEAIMSKARRNDSIIFNGETIMLFQDLSQITLRNRRALHPLLDKLREKEIKYTWIFPFALVVTLTGKQHILHTPMDLPDFYDLLNLDPIPLPEWYQECALPRSEGGPHRSLISSPDKWASKRPKQSRGTSSLGGTPNSKVAPSRASEEDELGGTCLVT